MRMRSGEALRRFLGGRPVLPPVLLSLVLLTSLAGGAPAAVVFEENFDRRSTGSIRGEGRIVETEDGYQGFTVIRSQREDYGGLILPAVLASRLRGDEGSIEFWLQRRSSGKGARERDPVLEFVDREERNFLTVYVQWEGSAYGGGGEVFLDGKRTADPAYDINVWGEIIPMGFGPRQGEWVHIALTYGPEEGDNAVYVNGERRTSAYPPLGSFAQVRGTALSPVTMKNGRLDFSGVEEVRVGAEGRHWDKGAGRGVRFLESSVIDDLRFHDRAVSDFDLTRIGAGKTDLKITALEHDAAGVAGFSGKLVAGDALTVILHGTPGVTATFDIARLADVAGNIHLDWEGYGVYLEEKIFFDEGEINLRDVKEYRVYAARDPLGTPTSESEPIEVLEVQEQSYTIEGLEGDVPYYVAVVAVMDDGTLQPIMRPRSGIPMQEVPESPGSYEGTYVVDYPDRFPEALVVGRLSAEGFETIHVGEEFFEADPALRITVLTTPDELEADEESRTEVMVTVADANQDPVPGHEIRFLLATTSQFTGVVGGGQFFAEVGGDLRRDFRGVTDMFGQVTATYTAGFAAKTAIIVARDMLSSDTGVGYVKTFIRARAEIELEALQEVAGKALGYALTLTSSDDWLTADGKSTARLTALVTRDGIPVEGHRVSFRVSSGGGSIRTVADVTGQNGKARAVYTAGKKIGIVLVTAVDQDVGTSATVKIELRSDAPAKIAITLSPEVLPADGKSTADIEVLVTDINDNPNEGVGVEYQIAIGSGRLKEIEEITDEDGISTAEFVAGRLPGKTLIEVTVRSSVPTEEELEAARGLAVAVTDYAFF